MRRFLPGPIQHAPNTSPIFQRTSCSSDNLNKIRRLLRHYNNKLTFAIVDHALFTLLFPTVILCWFAYIASNYLLASKEKRESISICNKALDLLISLPTLGAASVALDGTGAAIKNAMKSREKSPGVSWAEQHRAPLKPLLNRLGRALLDPLSMFFLSTRSGREALAIAMLTTPAMLAGTCYSGYLCWRRVNAALFCNAHNTLFLDQRIESVLASTQFGKK